MLFEISLIFFNCLTWNCVRRSCILRPSQPKCNLLDLDQTWYRICVIFLVNTHCLVIIQMSKTSRKIFKVFIETTNKYVTPPLPVDPLKHSGTFYVPSPLPFKNFWILPIDFIYEFHKTSRTDSYLLPRYQVLRETITVLQDVMTSADENGGRRFLRNVTNFLSD
jgi:hypothetical protein